MALPAATGSLVGAAVLGPLFAGALVGQGRSASDMPTALLPMVAIGGVAALWLAWRPPIRD